MKHTTKELRTTGKSKQKNFVIMFGAIFMLSFLATCKSTPQAKIKALPLKQKNGQAQTQIADQFYMSYAQLPCTIIFNDESVLRLKTDIRGTLNIPLKPGQTVIRLEYDFTTYKKHIGRVLARQDFRGYLRVKRKKGKLQTIKVQLSDKARMLVMLME